MVIFPRSLFPFVERSGDRCTRVALPIYEGGSSARLRTEDKLSTTRERAFSSFCSLAPPLYHHFAESSIFLNVGAERGMASDILAKSSLFPPETAGCIIQRDISAAEEHVQCLGRTTTATMAKASIEVNKLACKRAAAMASNMHRDSP